MNERDILSFPFGKSLSRSGKRKFTSEAKSNQERFIRCPNLGNSRAAGWRVAAECTSRLSASTSLPSGAVAAAVRLQKLVNTQSSKRVSLEPHRITSVDSASLRGTEYHTMNVLARQSFESHFKGVYDEDSMKITPPQLRVARTHPAPTATHTRRPLRVHDCRWCVQARRRSRLNGGRFYSGPRSRLVPSRRSEDAAKEPAVTTNVPTIDVLTRTLSPATTAAKSGHRRGRRLHLRSMGTAHRARVVRQQRCGEPLVPA